MAAGHQVRCRGRNATARDMPGHAMAVRRQRRSAGRAWARRHSRPDFEAAERSGAPPQSAARGVERPRLPAGEYAARRNAASFRRPRVRRAGLLHALVRGAGHRRMRRLDGAREHVLVGRRARQHLRRAVPSGEIRQRRSADPPQLPEGLRPAFAEGSGGAGMLTKRIIACLDVRDGQVVKGVQFQQLRHAGDPGELARRYNVEGIDEVVVLDITATLESRQALARTINAVAQEIFLPLTVGGGIRSEDDAAAAIDAGADKVSLNTAALRGPELITTLARRYGSQAVIVAIDAKRLGGGFGVFVRSGTTDAARDAVEWARQAESRGAGEILLTSIDRDGTKAGFDCELTAAVSDAVNIPVIASGGAGTFDHFAEVFTVGHADAALAASIFHFNERSVFELKEFLAQQDIPVRK